MGLGTSQLCTYTDEASQSEGTIYVSGQDVRTDFSAVSEGETMGTHMITDGTTTYMWFDGAESGFMSTFDSTAIENGSPDTSVSQQGSFDFDNQVDYSCTPWVRDAGKFDLPDMEFVDYSAMMPGNMMEANGEEGSLQNQCGLCDALPGDSQAECKESLGC
jgi:hypothetical protein